MPTKQDTRSNEERRREHRAARQRQQKMRRRIFYISLCLIVVIIGVILSLTVFFKVSKFEVSGDTIYSEDEIISSSGVKNGDNLFLLKDAEIERNICEKLPFIGSVKLDTSLPDKLKISVTETSIKCAVQYDNGYVLINEDGKVLGKVSNLEEVYKEAEKFKQEAEKKKAEESTTTTKATTKSATKADKKSTDTSKKSTNTAKNFKTPQVVNLANTTKKSEETTTAATTKSAETSAKPTETTTKKAETTTVAPAKPKYILGTDKLTIIKGLKVKSAVLGQKLVVSNEKSFSLYEDLMDEFSKNKISGITEIDLTDTVSIVLMYQDRIKIVLGSVSNMKDKIALAQNVLKSQNEISPYQKGTIDLSIDKKAYFSPEQETTTAVATTDPAPEQTTVASTATTTATTTAKN